MWLKSLVNTITLHSHVPVNLYDHRVLDDAVDELDDAVDPLDELGAAVEELSDELGVTQKPRFRFAR